MQTAYCAWIVSIHTLAWRVTVDDVASLLLSLVSIHTLAWRVTTNCQANFITSFSFNPHPRVEGDRFSHCPFKSASCFNPHPRVEGDLCRVIPTLTAIRFNPHPRVEGDSSFGCYPIATDVSIHTLAWRVTQFSNAV